MRRWGNVVAVREAGGRTPDHTAAAGGSRAPRGGGAGGGGPGLGCGERGPAAARAGEEATLVGAADILGTRCSFRVEGNVEASKENGPSAREAPGCRMGRVRGRVRRFPRRVHGWREEAAAGHLTGRPETG